MYCQLDQVKDVLDIAQAVRNALLREQPHNPKLLGCQRQACSVILGLLLWKEYDAFGQVGVIKQDGKEHRHHWVEVYLEGEAFVLDVTLSQWSEAVTEVVFLLKEEAAEEYGYGPSEDSDWQPQDAEESLWESVLQQLQIHQPVDEVLTEIAELVL